MQNVPSDKTSGMDFARSRLIMESPLDITADVEARRHRARVAGFKLVIGGALMPVGYTLAALKTYGHFKTAPTIIAVVASVLCLALGTWALIRTRR